jgi:uncharacterized NAD-dependent epimerase/dehydratase family protein
LTQHQRVSLRPGNKTVDGNAIVYCEGHFGTTTGKTANGLVRFTRRYRVMAVIDSTRSGDARELLDGKPAGIPILPDLARALQHAHTSGHPATHFLVGLAPDGGRLPAGARRDVLAAIEAGLHVDAGLHDFLSEDHEIAALAAARGVRVRDVRRPPPRSALHFFSGKIADVQALKLAVLGTDSAVGKRTTAWLLLDALERAGWKGELVGTGQTAWMQGVRYGLLLDSLVNDFVAGEIEHAVWSAWNEQRPDVILVEGQGSLLHPAYPGGFEILAAARPDGVIMQHAPARTEYDGFPGYPLHPLQTQIRAIELVSGRPVVAVTLNREGLSRGLLDQAAGAIEAETGLPTCEPIVHGLNAVVAAIERRFPNRRGAGRAP